METTKPVIVINNKEQSRFEVYLNGEYAAIDYRMYHGDIAFMHTHVPDAFRGRGIASAMAVAALEYARAQHYKIMLYCAFMSKYVKDHPEYQDLVDTFFHPAFAKN